MQLYFLIEVVKLCLASRLVRGINLCNNIKEYGGGGSSFRGGGTSMRKSKKNNSNHIKFHAQYLMHDILSLKFWGMRVMGRPTRPLPVPGPWGLPGLYQVYAGTRLKTTIMLLA